MKNAAKLVIFISLSFIGLLFFSGLITFLQAWINEALLFPPAAPGVGAALGNATFSGYSLAMLESSIPIAFYLSILLGLNYAIRRRIAYPAAFAVILVFILALSGAAYFGMESLGKMGFTIAIKEPPAETAKPGFILNQGALSGYQTVFLEDPGKPGGAAVLLLDGQPLNYQSQGPQLARTKMPFFNEKRGILTGIAQDFGRSSRVFSQWFNSGILSFAVYAGSLAAFLLSLGCLVNISFWSLANLFFGALAFRGVLALENFLNQGNIHDMLASFAGKLIHPSLITPLIFFILCILILLYSGLVYLARGKQGDG